MSPRLLGLVYLWLCLASGLEAAPASTGIEAGAAARTQNGAPAALPARPPTRVLCSVFPVYALGLELVQGSGIPCDLLLPAGLGCPHHYALTPTDLQRIEGAGALLMNGLGFEPFLDRIPRGASTTTVFAARGFPAMPSISEAGDNPHLFTTPRGLAHMATNLSEALVALDPTRASAIRENARTLLAAIAAQETEWEAAAVRLAGRPVLLAQDSLDYLARDLRLQVLAHLESGDTPTLSAKEMLGLIALVREKRPLAILFDSQQTSPAAETLARETGTPLIAIDTLARGPDPVPAGHLLRVLAGNLAALLAGLSPIDAPAAPASP